MSVKMKALRTFTGAEGFFRRGEEFEVDSESRAKDLVKAGLAERVEAAESPNMQEEIPLPEDEKPVETTENEVPPPQGEVWGLKSLGGGWYEIPGGERTQGFEAAKEHLYIHLQREFEPERAPAPKHEQEEESKAQVRLIEPVKEPEIIFTGEPEEEATQSSDPAKFEDDVKYLGGGWYELPNKERVQGKESARDVYEAYMRESGESE
jgi:hypothetical protein